MKKIWIVLKSEFIRRVRSFWFIVGTLLAPLFLVGISTLPALLGIAASSVDQRHIVVKDDTGVLAQSLHGMLDDQYSITESHAPAESLRASVMEGEYNGYLFLPESLLESEGEAEFYSVEGSGLSGAMRLERALTRTLEEHRLNEYEVSEEIRHILDTQVSVRTVKLTEEGEEEDSAAFYSILGYVMGFIIYAAMFIYGAYVIQGVLEEKTTRVIEVMVSSVRPFQMLMGKVLGIGAVGILQMTIWSILMLCIVFFCRQSGDDLPRSIQSQPSRRCHAGRATQRRRHYHTLYKPIRVRLVRFVFFGWVPAVCESFCSGVVGRGAATRRTGITNAHLCAHHHPHHVHRVLRRKPQ